MLRLSGTGARGHREASGYEGARPVGQLASGTRTRKTEFGKEGGAMSHAWAAGTPFRRKELSVEERACPFCGSYMHVCCHRLRHVFTLDGPVELLLRLVRCPQRQCPGRRRTYSPETETAMAMPRWALGWDVFAWLGHRRFSWHWSVPSLRAELRHRWEIDLSEDAIEKHLRRYQRMVAARQSEAAPSRHRIPLPELANMGSLIHGGPDGPMSRGCRKKSV